MSSNAASYRVAEAVARKEGVSLTELSPPLSHVVDPEALDALVQADAPSNDGHVEVQFTYRDYVVRVHGGAEVSVSVLDADSVADASEPAAE